MVCTYEEYLKRPKAITFAKMQTIFLFSIRSNPGIECTFGAVIFLTDIYDFLTFMIVPNCKNFLSIRFTFHNDSF